MGVDLLKDGVIKRPESEFIKLVCLCEVTEQNFAYDIVFWIINEK